MALDPFSASLFAQRKYFIQEIAGLDDVFDFLDEWPANKRDVSYERIVKVMRDAACKRFPASLARESFRHFLADQGKLVRGEDVLNFFRKKSDRNIGGT
ncbi:hypothetical protein ATY81_25420 [Rhizobium sp. R72]|uniref:DUF982 domain-containing protein n=1 Tax=unclassified Rhizobium TaxID=2613769 RepID=UPI000B538704|nr:MULTISPECIES: DUF982 domain-containing protein [unclassified Rhizobium]OWW00135.1 hypothetical protein ATY81_25420 [Rhizobium sp. R72]OWW00526.1 hypothetical protein ATY80_25420 [Rhizobium sp. R711]